MILDPRIKINQPESVILHILSTKVRLTSKELFEFFTKQYSKSMTLQGFYKVVKKMLDDRILVKEGLLVSLDSFWVNRVIEFSKRIENLYLQTNSNSPNILLEEGENKVFEFENIMAMDNLWCHGLNIVRNYYTNNKHKDINAYSRNYYSVFQIARTESENVTTKSFEDSKMNWYMASGSNTFLNKIVPKLMEEENYHQFIYNFDNYQKEHNNVIQKNYWVTVIGDFIFEARLPKYIFELIEKIYEETQSISEFNSNRLNGLFLESGKSILEISRNKKKAELIREEIKKLYINRIKQKSP